MAWPGNFFENRTKVWAALILPALVIYFQSLKFDYTVLDEQWMIVQNPSLLQGRLALREAFTHSFAGLYYRPLLLSSIWLDYQFGKLSPFVYHATNLLLHLLSVCLLFRFLRLNKVSNESAFVYALIFSVHPLALHAVAWIPGRNDLLLCVFTLAALISLIHYHSTHEKKWVALHFLFFICALLTKENAIVLPLVFFGFYLLYGEKKKKELVLLLSGWFLFSAAWLYIRGRIVEVPAPGGMSLQEVVKNFIPALLVYIGKAILPFQQSVMPLLRNASLIPGLAALGILILLAFKPGIKDRRLAGLGLLLFFSLLSVPVWVGSVKSGSELYEHRLYTSLAGMMLFFSQLKFNVQSKTFRYAAGLVFCVFCLKTYLRMDIYKNKDLFIDAGVREARDYYLFLFQKSESLSSSGNYDSALAYSNRALALRSDKSQIYSSRGYIVLRPGQIPGSNRRLYQSHCTEPRPGIQLLPQPLLFI